MIIRYDCRDIIGYIILDRNVYIDHKDNLHLLNISIKGNEIGIWIRYANRGSANICRYISNNVLMDPSKRISFTTVNSVSDLRLSKVIVRNLPQPLSLVYIDDLTEYDIIHSSNLNARIHYIKTIYRIDEITCIVDMISTKHNRRLQFKIDVDVVNNLLKDGIFINASQASDGNFYLRLSDGTPFHRYVMGVTDSSLVVDHINRDTRDNRRCNLNVTTPSGNSRNLKTRFNSKTGVKGVTIGNVRGHLSYVARCNVKDNRRIISKTFSINKFGKEEAFRMAVEYRKELEIKYNII